MEEESADRGSNTAPKMNRRCIPVEIDEYLEELIEENLTSIHKQLQNIHEELSDAMKPEHLPNILEEHDRPCCEDMSSKAISENASANPKLPLSSATTRSTTQGYVGVQKESIPQTSFPDDSEKLPKCKYMEYELSPSTTRPIHNSAGVTKKCRMLEFVGQIRNKSCVVTVDIWATSTTIRPDIAEGLPERKPAREMVLRTSSGQRIPVIKEVLVTLIVNKCSITTWAKVADIELQLVLGLDFLRENNVILNTHRNVLRIDGQEVLLSCK
jgi:hypothetical protein